MKYVVVTGVSTGIGYGAAEELVRHGINVFGSVRKEDDATRVGSALGSAFTPLLFDVTDEAAVQAGAVKVKDRIGSNGLSGLVNNAGIVVAGPLAHIPLDEVRYQFEVNVIGLLNVTQAFLPLLGAQKHWPYPPGRIVNISSVSGGVAYPFVGPYAASKHAVEALSDALRRELLLYGIDVIVIEPGNISTPIWDKVPEASPYQHTDYAPMLARVLEIVADRRRDALPVTLVSRAIRLALTSQQPKTRHVIANHRLTHWLLPRWIPDRWLDRLIARRLGMKY
jgi:NAD(P)-dependent dehydrogenase (short-subunit alcohol dehydrogenase family)